MKSEAEHFLKCPYNCDWSPTAIAKGQGLEGSNSEEDELAVVPEPPKPTAPSKRKLSVKPYVCLVYCTLTKINRLLYVL